MKSNWITSVPLSSREESDLDIPGISGIIKRVLLNRGLSAKTDIENFLYPEINQFHSPFLLKGMEEAVARIRKAVENSENIAIFADSDLDGITSLTIINDLLVKLGIKPHIRYPREKEGYGLTVGIIDEFSELKVNLVITVDSGVRDVSEIEYAGKLGIDFIVTDHHEAEDVIPDAVVINPKQGDCSYPFRDLAGVGVAMKLAKGVMFSYLKEMDNLNHMIFKYDHSYYINRISRFHIEPSDKMTLHELTDYIKGLNSENDFAVFCSLTDDDVKKLTEVCTVNNSTFEDIFSNLFKCGDSRGDIFTIAREMGLRDVDCISGISIYSRVFLELQVRSRKSLMGKIDYYTSLAALGTVADIMPLKGENRLIVKHGLSVINKGQGHNGIMSILKNRAATTKSLGWDVAPLLNAPGRLGMTECTVDFFLNSTEENSEELIRELNRLNRQRRSIVTETIERIESETDCFSSNLKNLFYFYDDQIPEGVSGLVANRISDIIHKPVIILSNSCEENLLKGSGRSPDGLGFFNYVEPFSEMFERIGGHSQAFGFTLNSGTVDAVMERIDSSLNDVEIVKTYNIDSIIETSEIDVSLLNEIELLEPYGKDNPEPLFCSRNIQVQSFKRFGAKDNHGKYVLKNGFEVIGWNMADTMESRLNSGKSIDILYHLEKNIFRNYLTIRLNLVDID